MRSSRLPFALVLVATSVMMLYPRLLPATAADWLRGDFAVGCVYGACIGLELVALFLLRRQQRTCSSSR
jgi:hypothetical protein